MQAEDVMDETSEQALPSASAVPASEAPPVASRRRRLFVAAGAQRGTRSLWVVGEAVKIIRAAREWTRSELEPALWADHELSGAAGAGDLDAGNMNSGDTYGGGGDEHNARELWHARRTTLAFSALTVGAVTGACSARGVTRAAFTVLAVPPAAVAAWTGTFSYLIDVHQRISRTHRHRPPA